MSRIKDGDRITVFGPIPERGFVPVDPEKTYDAAYLRQFAGEDGEIYVSDMPDRSKG